MYELLRERNGKFVPTGEFIPEGRDPHDYIMERQARDGVAYSARIKLTTTKATLARGRALVTRYRFANGFVWGAATAASIYACVVHVLTHHGW